jgi:ribosomal-protein-serine acetyltransferase
VRRFELAEDRSMRPLVDSDADELFALIDANRRYLARWMPFVGQTRSAADSLVFIRAARRQVAEHRGVQMAVLADERIIGVAGLHRVDWIRRSTCIGYWLAESHQGAGIMTLAAAALVDHAFGEWELRRVEIHAGVRNHRSRAIPQRLGFHQEATVAGAERIGERVIDHVIYAIGAQEWTFARPARISGSLRA